MRTSAATTSIHYTADDGSIKDADKDDVVLQSAVYVLGRRKDLARTVTTRTEAESDLDAADEGCEIYLRLPQLQILQEATQPAKFAGAAWENRRHLTSQCGFLCTATEENFMDGHAAPCNRISWHSKKCPRIRSKLNQYRPWSSAKTR